MGQIFLQPQGHLEPSSKFWPLSEGHTPGLGPRQPTQPRPELEGCPAAGGKRQKAGQRAEPTTSSRPLPGPFLRSAGQTGQAQHRTHTCPLTAVTLATGGGEFSAPRPPPTEIGKLAFGARLRRAGGSGGGGGRGRGLRGDFLR